MNTIEDILNNHPLVLAGRAAALAEVYYGNVLDKNKDVTEIGYAYDKAFSLCPNWRKIIQDAARRYYPITDEITSLPTQWYRKETHQIGNLGASELLNK